MAVKTINLLINENLFDDCPFVGQQYEFPACLLSYQGNKVGNTSNSTSKYNFVMSLAEFERSLKPMFDEKETIYYTEYYYDTNETSEVKENNIWIKIVDRGTEKHVSVKRTQHVDSGEIKYQEKIIPLAYAVQNIPGLIELLREQQYVIEVERTKYELKEDKNLVLTLDKSTFEDDSSFVVFSITADFEGSTDEGHSEVATYPCRSKIVELISKTQPTLYKSLINNGDVKVDVEYKSMSQAEFEAGPEEAEKRKQQAESEKRRMETENEYLEDDDKYSDAYMKTRYRSVLKYGLFKFDDDDDE